MKNLKQLIEISPLTTAVFVTITADNKSINIDCKVLISQEKISI